MEEAATFPYTTATANNGNTKWIATISFVVGLIGLAVYFTLLNMDSFGGRKKKPKRILPADAQPDKSVIECDNTDCTNKGPNLRCAKCNMVYYCSKDCQKQHWKSHKADCQTAVEKIYAKFTDSNNEDNDNRTETEAKQQEPKNTTCGICLQDDIANPIVLKNCQHMFCLPCLEQYQTYQDLPQAPGTETGSATSNTKCPYCRTEMKETSLRETVISKALLYAARATRSGNSEQDKVKACRQALAELQTLGEPTSDQDVLQANTICGHIAMTKGDYKDALKIWDQNLPIWTQLVERKKKVDLLLEEGRTLGQQAYTGDDDDATDDKTYQAMQQIQNQIMAIMSEGGLAHETDLINCRLEGIQVRLEMKEWDAAMEGYKDLMTTYPEPEMMTPSQQRKVFMGFARCLYEQGAYDASIQLGESALQMNRHFPGSHKYVALSYQKKGDIKKAQQVMGQAVLYETSWDPVNVQEARDLWRELMEMTED